jgi:addiction module HigA family antidote
MKTEFSRSAKHKQKQKTAKSEKILHWILPGKVLEKDFMKPRGLTPDQVGHEIGVPVRQISEIVRETRALTLDIARSLGRYLGSSAQEEWLLELNILCTVELHEAAVKMTLAELKYALKGLKRGNGRRPVLKKLLANLKICLKGLKGCRTLSQIQLRAVLRSNA